MAENGESGQPPRDRELGREAGAGSWRARTHRGPRAHRRPALGRLLRGAARRRVGREYDPAAGRQLGNTPQAFSLVGLVNTARLLSGIPTGTGTPAD
ncbi:hypothetical protein [Actinoplanes regularis]|uniref:hypothetical protein n=1 Tax=Actinoplanes regularis TaxID=52697 RepID=UPI0025563C95|nr:hypothetical protein [Actinoplanes regularis]